MTDVKITLPKLGESIQSATVVQWFKKIGDHVKEDEPLLEVTTDKVNSEIPSTVSGVLKQIIANVDDEIEVGQPLALISTDIKNTEKFVVENKFEKQEDLPNEGQSDKNYLSPAVIRLAQEKGLSLDSLSKIRGSGSGGRISKKDIEQYLIEQENDAVVSEGPSVEKLKMSGMRKAIADNMVRSFYEAPHASLISEVDMTEIVRYIKQNKENFQKTHGFKLTITSFIAQAIAQALKEFPLINSSLEGDTIVVKRFVNLGIAVSIDQGIMVPVIKNCQNRSIEDLAKQISILSSKARDQKLHPDDTQSGTITMTNFGMSGTLIGIPIIRYPEVAIIGIGAITKKVVAFDDDTFAVRSMMHVSLTFDHRVLDGMYGCGFLKSLKDHLEKNLN